jgi:predicted RNA binding protein YcfA (HicA-like mRNA interferase family)
MTKPARLYALLLQSTDRSVDFRDFLAMIQAFGFVFTRSRGSHQSYTHPACPALLVVQPRGKDAKRYQIREFLGIVEEYGLKLDD